MDTEKLSYDNIEPLGFTTQRTHGHKPNNADARLMPGVGARIKNSQLVVAFLLPLLIQKAVF